MPTAAQKTDAKPLRQTIRFAILAFLAAFGFYMLLAGSISWTECAAGGFSGVAVAAFATIKQRYQDRSIQLAPPPARVMLSMLASLFAQTGRVGVTLFKAVRHPGRGEAAWQGFHPGGGNSRDAGRRALVTVMTSLAPNGIVLDVRPSGLTQADNGLLVHSLAPASPLTGTEWPR